jgi:hypothetical protein
MLVMAAMGYFQVCGLQGFAWLGRLCRAMVGVRAAQRCENQSGSIEKISIAVMVRLKSPVKWPVK